MHRRPLTWALALALCAPPVALAQSPRRAAPAAAAAQAKKQDARPAWVVRSDAHTRFVLEALARFSPEGAGEQGIEGLDEQISDLTPGHRDRERAATLEVLAQVRARLAAEKDPRVQQDLRIVAESLEDDVRAEDLARRHFVPVPGVPQRVFSGLQALLDARVAPARRPAALVRLRKYVGLVPGTRPMSELAMAEAREAMAKPGLLMPLKEDVERRLAGSAAMVAGIGPMFQEAGVAGWEEPVAKLKEQVAAYDAFLREEVLPRARTDYRLPPEVYANNLERLGVDVPPEQLAAQARAAYTALQAEMQQVAAQVAKERGFADPDYRAVIRELKKEQLVGEAILPHYRARLKELEDIIRRERLVTLPRRAARIRLGTEAESARSPAPHMRPPRLVDNTGEQGEFVLPLAMPSSDPAQVKRTDDFTFAAASWTLTAHEARPGHEMQFARMVEGGVSLARALFAFNSTNVEGWGLYSERIVLPYMPAEGRLVSLQHRLMRAARAFCDPELQLGRTTPAKVKALLMEEVMLSDAMATQEVERYTFRAPGQATSYFHGYTKLVALREEVERALGKRFDARRFHDFVLAQGLLPADLLREAVLKELVKK